MVNKSQKSKILIVDDDLGTRIALKEILKKKYEIVESENGKKALDILHKKKIEIDLILLDIIMPEMDGFSVLKRLKAKKITKNIPVLVVSSLVESTDTKKALEMGAVDFIRKPLDAVEILARVQTHLLLAQTMNRNLQLAQEANETKQKFIGALAKISHDIRNNLNTIDLSTDYILEECDNLNENDFTSMKQIRLASKSALGLVDDLLYISRLESGKFELEPSDFDLIAFLSNIFISAKQQAQAKKIDFNSWVEEDVPRFVTGDPKRLGQVIQNLLANAIKFTSKGEVRIIVAKREETKNHAEVIFKVDDSGVGIPKEFKKKIFLAFAQADTSNSVEYSGTGLGLAICKQIVELMHGEIGVESVLNVGSQFWFTVLLKKSLQKNIEKGSHYSKKEKNIELPELSILLAEDNPANQRLLKLWLEAKGQKVDVASNGKEAIKKLLESSDYDIILMDVEMPEMNGIEATKIIKSQMNFTIPIIAMTGLAMKGDREKCLKAGMDDYVLKPVKIDLLLETIKNALKLI